MSTPTTLSSNNDQYNTLQIENQRLRDYITSLELQLKQQQNNSNNKVSQFNTNGMNNSNSSIYTAETQPSSPEHSSSHVKHNYETNNHSVDINKLTSQTEHHQLQDVKPEEYPNWKQHWPTILREWYFPSNPEHYYFEYPIPYIKKLFSHHTVTQFHPQSLFVSFWSAFCTFVALTFNGTISNYLGVPSHFQILFAYNGAAACILYCLHDNPTGMPRNMIVGHVIGSLTSVVITKSIFGLGTLTWLAASLSVAFAIFFMQITGTTNPPAAAAALFYATAPKQIQEYGYKFVGVAVTGAAIIVLVAWLFNNMIRHLNYPKKGWI